MVGRCLVRLPGAKYSCPTEHSVQERPELVGKRRDEHVLRSVRRDCFLSEPLGLLVQPGTFESQGRLVRYRLEKPCFVVGKQSTFAIQKTERTDDLTVKNDRNSEDGPKWS